MDLSTKIGEYRRLTGKRIPPQVMFEWKTIFHKGLPLYPEEPEIIAKVRQSPSMLH